MLNESEITLVESVYLVLDREVLTSEIALQIQDYVYKHNFEQHVYLQWLINRWSVLKRDKHHLPLRRLNLNEYVESHPIVKLQNKKNNGNVNHVIIDNRGIIIFVHFAVSHTIINHAISNLVTPVTPIFSKSFTLFSI